MDVVAVIMNRPERIEITGVIALQTRLRLGMSRRQLASSFRVSPNTLAAWERGLSPIPWVHRQAYCKMIALTPHLLARRANPNWDL